jgi:hypothetical protein
MNLPEIIYGLNEFNFDVALDVGKIPPADNAANHIPAFMIRKDDLLTGRQWIHHPKYAAIVEYDDGPALLPRRADGPGDVAIFTRQTSESDGNFKANWIGSRR